MRRRSSSAPSLSPAAYRRRTRRSWHSADEPTAIELGRQLLLVIFLEIQPGLVRSAAAQFSGIIGRASGTAKDGYDRLAIDVSGLQLQLVQQAAVVKTGARLIAVGKTGAEVRVFVGAQDAEIA